MALAQAMIEYIMRNIKAKTLFSTHYHELTEMAEKNAGIRNVHVDVHEEDDKVTFLYRVLDGKADKSYGINVARLAHLPFLRAGACQADSGQSGAAAEYGKRGEATTRHRKRIRSTCKSSIRLNR